jgi:hypothetical protein
MERHYVLNREMKPPFVPEQRRMHYATSEFEDQEEEDIKRLMQEREAAPAFTRGTMRYVDGRELAIEVIRMPRAETTLQLNRRGLRKVLVKRRLMS